MRMISKLLLVLGGLLTLTAACSSTSPAGTEPKGDSGTSRDSSAPHDGASSIDSGGPATTLSGTSHLTFTPKFIGSAAASGSCPVCGGLPMPGDGGGGGSFPSGPASYNGVVIVLSDDPNLEASCTSDAAAGYTFNFDSYHYLTIQVVSIDAISAGTYAVHSALSQADGGVSYGYVDDSVPASPDASSGIGYDNEDNGRGTVTLTGVGGTVLGTFNVTGLELFGGGASQGNLSGSFVAPSCPSLANSAFQGPCGGCPG